MSRSIYTVGDIAEVVFENRSDVDDELTDVDDMSVSVVAEDGTTTSFTLGSDGELQHTGLGVYNFYFDTTSKDAGIYRINFIAGGVIKTTKAIKLELIAL